MKRLIALFAASIALVALALPATGTARDSRCSYRFGTVNERTRYIRSSDPLGAVVHDMSDYPVCSPHGPSFGTAKIDSQFTLEYADPQDSAWCYGWSPSVGHHGYVLCSQLKTTRG